MINIDGSYLEGGGQIVRSALGLSTLFGKKFYVDKIRQGRKVPGLKQQHLTAIRTLEGLCKAEVSPVDVGSTELTYTPGALVPRTMGVDIGTAGSVTLLLQSLWAPLILGGGKFRLKIKGGTDVMWSMPFDYMNEVFIPQMRRYAEIDAKLVRRGFYPKGGGEIDFKVKGTYTLDTLGEAAPINLVEQGHLVQIRGVSYATTDLQKAEVAERQMRAARKLLTKYEVPVNIDVQYSDSFSTGSGIVLWAICSLDADDVDVANPIRLGADCLGERGKRAEIVGEEAAKKLVSEIDSGAAVDSHLADNLVPFIALFGGAVKTSEITDHTKTNVYAVSRFLGDVLEVDEENKIIKSNILHR